MVFHFEILAALALIACVKGQPGQISLTATNSITFVYVDNVRKFPLPNAADWQTVDTLPIDTYSRLVAVRASNILGSCSGLLVAISDHPTGYSFVSDNRWVCSANPASGWEYLGFDDSTWAPAHQVGRNGGIPGGCLWSTISDIPETAYWIWTSNHTNGDNVVSCRGYTPICDYSPCLNGGTCNRNTSNLCSCSVRWGGQFCEIDLTDCGSNPCQNGGTCIFRVTGGYQCDCEPGYSGSNCEIDIKVCDSSPCQNGGSCILDVAGGYRCACIPGFSGLSCEIDLKVCDSNPCRSGGTCIIKVDGGYYCDCAPEFSGTNCELEISRCTIQPCQHGGTCAEDVSDFTCYCLPEYTGTLCETEIPPCAIQPCQNGGTCIEYVSGFTCHCLPGYSGTFCEAETDECLSEPCLNGATCLDQVDDYTCQCSEWFTGSHCETDTCTMLSDRGYPVLIQQHINGSAFFDRSWDDMLKERGTPEGDYWYGLQELSQLIIKGQGRYQLHINLTAVNGIQYFARYETISIGGEEDNFTLTVGGYSGDSGVALAYHSHAQFSSFDRDNDKSQGGNLAMIVLGAWWYNTGCYACLNAPATYFVWTNSGSFNVALYKDSMYLICSNLL